MIPGAACARFALSWGVGDRNPELTLSDVELMVAYLAPSELGCTLVEAGRGSAGSVPKVTV